MSGTRLGAASALLALSIATATASAASPPTTPPPKVSGARTAPPPAWIELPSAPSRWLAYSSFCWKTACVDFLPPQMRPDLPRVRAALGKVVRFHLSFKPSRLVLDLAGSTRSWRLASARVSAWRVAARGTLVLQAKGPGGSAGYAIRIA